MTTPLEFPSRDWSLALSRLLHGDAEVQTALTEFGAFTAGAILEKGDGLTRDFCVHIEAAPGREPKLRFCDDEDELDELEPDYLVRAPHRLARELIKSVLAGAVPDPLKLLTTGQASMRGDLGRVVRVAGRYPTAGLAALRSLPTRTIS